MEATGLATPVPTGTATALDNVSGVLVPLNNAPAGALPLGATTVTYTATDAAGNIGTATQLVTVVDSTPPVVVAPLDVKVEASSLTTPVNLSAATVTDKWMAC